ncbi:MAG: hypothetical protein KJI69_05925 [Patescibacteria group bacterium]|nr:hypothetical protein [Patescibacteria group bacterium]
MIHFDLSKQYSLIDFIVRAQALYIQPGRPGDKITNSLERPRLIVEVPDMGFSNDWDIMLLAVLTKKLRTQGLSRQRARADARELILKWRTLSDFRMGI